MSNKDYKLVCEICKSDDIERKMWVNPNSNEVISSSSGMEDSEDNWCNNCANHTPLIEIELITNELDKNMSFTIDFTDFCVKEGWEIENGAWVNTYNGKGVRLSTQKLLDLFLTYGTLNYEAIKI